MALKRKKTFTTFREATKLGPYVERPMLPDSVQQQIHLSRNTGSQPFFLICEKDTLIAVFSGTGRVELRASSVAYFPLEPGDHVYVPAGTPTRLHATEESIILRYKAQHPGLEAVAWYCETCRAELYRHIFDTTKLPSQAGYINGCAAFDADEELRRCPGCAAEHPPVQFEPDAWREIAQALSS